MAKEHDVKADFAGFGLGHPRLTCFTESCGGATCVRQPWMNDTKWQEMRAAFLKQHPCTRIDTLR